MKLSKQFRMGIESNFEISLAHSYTHYAVLASFLPTMSYYGPTCIMDIWPILICLEVSKLNHLFVHGTDAKRDGIEPPDCQLMYERRFMVY